MKDLVKQLEMRGAEISQYLAEIAAERESHTMRLTELDMNQKNAENDLRKINRAIDALIDGGDIPMGPAPESPRAQELQGMVASRPYSPGRD